MWYRSVYRVFARARRGLVQEWFGAFVKARPELNMAPGRHITDAIWRSLVWQFLTVTSVGGSLAEWKWDLQKAFDHVDRGKL
jgi:hypothetical protein